MRVASLALVVVIGTTACPVEVFQPGERIIGPIERQCGSAVVNLVNAGDLLEGLGDAVVTAADVSDNVAVVHFGEEGDASRDLAFVVDLQRAPLLPAAGPVNLVVRQAACFGEGCDPAWFSVSNDDGALFYVGRANTLDAFGIAAENAVFAGPDADDPVHVRVGLDSEVCPGQDEYALAVVVVDTDDGPAEFFAGGGGDVVIDGHPWFVIVGAATRNEFTQDDADCVDCAAVGPHNDTSIQLVLYRVDVGT